MKEERGTLNADLPPTVEEALEALRPVPDIDPEAWEARREAYLLEVRRLAASREDRRPAGWLAPVLSFLKLDSDPERPLAVVWRTALIIALVLGGSVGTVSAARASLPGSPFYPLKVRLERWEIERLQEPEKVTAEALSHAQMRVEEAERLASRGRGVPQEVAAIYEERLETALQASGALSEPQRLQAQVHISLTVRQQLEVMASVAGQVQGEDDDLNDEDGVRALIRAMQQTQARIGDSEHEGHDDNDDKPGYEAGEGDGPQGPPEMPGGAGCDDDAGVCRSEEDEDADDGAAGSNGDSGDGTSGDGASEDDDSGDDASDDAPGGDASEDGASEADESGDDGAGDDGPGSGDRDDEDQDEHRDEPNDAGGDDGAGSGGDSDDGDSDDDDDDDEDSSHGQRNGQEDGADSDNDSDDDGEIGKYHGQDEDEDDED